MNTEGGFASAGPLSAYLGELEPDAAAALGAIVVRAQTLVPALTQGTSYGMPALLHRGKPLLSVVQRATHLAYYPHSGRVMTAVVDDLAEFSLSKGTVRFSVEKPLPASVVDRLILDRRDEIDRGYRG